MVFSGVDVKRLPANDQYLADPKPPERVVEGEVYNIKIMMSTGEGYFREDGPLKTSVFERNLQRSIGLKTKAGRATYSDIQRRFPTMPFSLRQIGSTRGLLGVKECVAANLIVPIAPCYEMPKELVACYQFTAMVHNGKTISLSNYPLQKGLKSAVGLMDDSVAAKVIAKGKHSSTSWGTYPDLANSISNMSVSSALSNISTNMQS